MIPLGQLIAKPDAGLKLLTPWWDVLAHYLTAAMVTIALTATALQAALDNLICIPAVDCSEFVDNPLAVWNKTLPDNSLLGELCSKGKPALDLSRTIVMTTMSARRDYDFVDSSCFQQTLPWFTAFFPFIIFGEAVLIFLIDNFWSKMPRTSSTLNHFVALVTECYNAEGSLSDVLKEISEKENPENNGEEIASAVSGKPEKQPLVDMTDLGQKSDSHENQDPTLTLTPSSMSNAVAINTLFEKVSAFQCRYRARNTLLRVYILRAFLQSMVCLIAFVLNIFYFSSLINTINCHLKEVFITNYEFFHCSRFIAPFYRAIVVILAIPLLMCFGTSLYALCWVFHNSRKSKVNCTNNSSEYIRGDMSLLFFLLKEYDKLYSNRLDAFLSKEKRNTIEKNIDEIHKTSLA